MTLFILRGFALTDWIPMGGVRSPRCRPTGGDW